MKTRNWQDATFDTVERLRAIHTLNPKLSEDDLAKLYSQARLFTQAMGVQGARFWPVFVNTLRILIATRTPSVTREDLFADIPEHVRALDPNSDEAIIAASLAKRGRTLRH